jgi:hypothetical protein
VETAGDAMGFLDRRVGGDLDRFKEFIERTQEPTGAWEGEIHGDEVIPDESPARGTGSSAASSTAISSESTYGGPTVDTLPGDEGRQSSANPSSGSAPD